MMLFPTPTGVTTRWRLVAFLAGFLVAMQHHHQVLGFVPAPSPTSLSRRSRATTTTTTTTTSPSFQVASPPLYAAASTAANTAFKQGAVVKNSFVKGKLTLFLSKFLVSPRQALHIGQRLALTIKKDLLDFVLIVAVYQLVVPLGQRLYARQHPELASNEENDNSDRFATRFSRSKTNRTAQLVQEVAFLFGLLYGFEIGLVLLDELGFEFVRAFPVYQWVSGLVASWWGARNLSEFKDFVITRGNRIDINKSGNANSNGKRLLSRFLDILIYGGTTLVALDFLDIQTGFALRSFFGLSSVGTLVFSLASKELVSEFLAGLAIQGTNMYTGK
jgi:hypothetical protein